MTSDFTAAYRPAAAPQGVSMPQAVVAPPLVAPATERAGVAPPVDPTLGAPLVAPEQPPPLPEFSEEANMAFEQVHGRSPTTSEKRIISAAPQIARSLGRPPTRIELEQFIEARGNMPEPPQQFE